MDKQEIKPMTYLSKSMQESRNRSNRKAIDKRKGQKPAYPPPSKNAPKRILKRLQPRNPFKHRSALKRVYKPTGEKQLFLKIWQERGGKCEITGKSLIFPIPSNFMHILSKGAYPKFRLLPENIMLVFSCIHNLYDNSSKAKLLSQFPAASIIYEKKQQLKQQYYNVSRTQ